MDMAAVKKSPAAARGPTPPLATVRFTPGENCTDTPEFILVGMGLVLVSYGIYRIGRREERDMGRRWAFWRQDAQQVQWRQRRQEATSAAQSVAGIAERIARTKRPIERDMESLHLEMTHLTAAFAGWLEADKTRDRR